MFLIPFFIYLPIPINLYSGKDVDLTEGEPHTVSGTLKLFLIEPEESILTDELYESFLAAIGNNFLDDLSSLYYILHNDCWIDCSNIYYLGNLYSIYL